MVSRRNSHACFEIYWNWSWDKIGMAFIFVIFSPIAQLSTQTYVLVKEVQKSLVGITSVLLFISSFIFVVFLLESWRTCIYNMQFTKLKMHVLLKFTWLNSFQWGSWNKLKNELPVNKLISEYGDVAKVIPLYMRKLKIISEILEYSCIVYKRGHRCS